MAIELSNLNSWDFYTRENPFYDEKKKCGKKYVAHVNRRKTLTIEDIAAAIVEQQGSEISVETIVDILLKVEKKEREFLSAGYSIARDNLTIMPKIQGSFSKEDEAFNDKVHSKKFILKPSRNLKNALKAVSVSNTGAGSLMYKITGVQDLTTKKIDNTLTKGGTIVITGKNIRLCDSENGDKSYVCLKSGEEEIKIYVDKVVDTISTCNQITLNLPNEAEGSFELFINTYFSGKGTQLKNARLIRYDELVTIA